MYLMSERQKKIYQEKNREDQYNEECSQCAVKIDGKVWEIFWVEDNYFVEYEGMLAIIV